MAEEDITVESLIARMRAHPLDDHAQEIGRVCMMWSRLEMSLSILLSLLFDIKDPTTNNVVLGCLDFRAKLHALLPMAFYRKRTLAWFEKLQSEVNEIDNDLRPERNRIIHDYWLNMPDGAVHRMQMGAKLVNDQREKKLLLAQVKPITVSDLIVLTIRIAKAGGVIDSLADEYRLRPPSPPTLEPPTPAPNPDRD